MNKPTASDKRFDAITALVAAFIDPTTGEFRPGIGESADTVATREAVCVAILNLRSLGRTDRWKGECAQWFRMVNEKDTELATVNGGELKFAHDLHWALVQGAIFAGHAAL